MAASSADRAAPPVRTEEAGTLRRPAVEAGNQVGLEAKRESNIFANLTGRRSSAPFLLFYIQRVSQAHDLPFFMAIVISKKYKSYIH